MRRPCSLCLPKIALVLLFCTFLFGLHSWQLQAGQATHIIRIGLESNFHNQAQITIPSTNISIGQVINGQFQSSGTLSSSGGFVARPDSSYYIRSHQTFPDLTQAQAAAAAHTGAVPVFLDNGSWGLLLPPLDGTPGDVVFPSANRILLSAGGQTVLVSENMSANLQFQDVQGITSLGARQYRGVIELGRFGGSGLTAVNVIDIEEYLWSVVPAEMPAGWHPEALKAQAVAARTYAIFRLGSLAHRGYDLCDTTFSQVYPGVDNESPNTTAAVNATRGIMIWHNGDPIEAVYFSSSGGFTDNSENVWVSAVPYLRAVADTHETTGREWTRTVTLAQLNSILSTNNANIGTATGIHLGMSTNGRVQELTITGTSGSHVIRGESIRRVFSPALYSRNFTIAGGSVARGMPAAPQGSSAQGAAAPEAPQAPPGIRAYAVNSQAMSDVTLQGLQVQGQHGQASLGQGSISVQAAGRVVNLQTASTTTPGAQPNQPPQPDRPQIGNAVVSSISSTGDTIELTGRGWGHGVGMSQHGAHGMAQAGFDFRQILMHYYTGVVIQ